MLGPFHALAVFSTEDMISCKRETQSRCSALSWQVEGKQLLSRRLRGRGAAGGRDWGYKRGPIAHEGTGESTGRVIFNADAYP